MHVKGPLAANIRRRFRLVVCKDKTRVMKDGDDDEHARAGATIPRALHY